MRILLVEDDHRLSDALKYMLEKENFGVDTAFDGVTGYDMASTGIYDGLVLDWMLPGMEGIEIVRTLRKEGIQTPILMLTAKETVRDRVVGLDAGADDYLVKPFSTEEFFARVRALCRRHATVLKEELLHAGALRLDMNRCEAHCEDEILKLTIKEAQLLEYLMKNKGKAVSREQILDRVWGLDTEIEQNNIEIYVYYLRKKLNPEKCHIRIETIRGIGYSLKEDSDV